MAAGRRRTGFGIGALGMLCLIGSIAAAPGQSIRNDAPVADAAQRGDLEAVRTLLRGGADVNAAQADGMTALHWSALNGNLEITRVLLYAGATPQVTTRLGGYTPLHLASRNGHGPVVRALVEGGSDPNAMTTTGVTALHFAATANSVEAVRALVEHGAEVDARDTFAERTPLIFAAASNARDAMQALIDAGADPGLTTTVKDYTEISREASEERSRRNRIRAAAEDPDPDDEREQRGPLRAAAARSGRGAPPDTASAQGQGRGRQGPPEPPTNPGSGEPERAEEPPEPPSDPVPFRSEGYTEQVGTQGGFTALHYAARDGHVEAALLLLDAGADVNRMSGGDGSTPLLVAAINGNYDLAAALLERGADPNIVSDDGAGPLFATLNIEWSLRTWYPQPQAFRQQETSYLELMEKLLLAGADPNARVYTHIWYTSYNAGRMGVDFTGATPFWRAAYGADVDAMRLLVEYGADPNIWTYNLSGRRELEDPDVPNNPANNREPEPTDPSGLPPVPHGGPAVHPLHAASGVGFGTSRVAQQHRHVPDGWLPAVRYLVDELGIDPNIRDDDGYTPLHHAAARGDNETILFLVSRGADVTAISRRGQTVADLANSPEQRAQPHPATVALLEKLGSKNNHNCRSCGG